MKTYKLILILILNVLISSAQDYKLTFALEGEVNSIDSVIVENVTQNTRIKLNGNDTLFLTKITGIKTFQSADSFSFKAFPNPTSSAVNLQFTTGKSEHIVARIFDIEGRELLSGNWDVTVGIHTFKVKNLPNGILVAQVSSGNKIEQIKIVSLQDGSNQPEISAIHSEHVTTIGLNTKSATEARLMDYVAYDNIVVRVCPFDAPWELRRGFVMKEEEPLPEENHTFVFEYIKCEDKCGNRYNTVEIGDQIWIAENFRCPTEKSWIYDNNPNNVQKYGLLYTWEDALNNAPEGWHLPSDDEWNEMLEYLQKTYGDNFPLALKSKTGWMPDENQNSSNGNDASGFNAVPGGARWFYDGSFYANGESAYFWSATRTDSIRAAMMKITKSNTEITNGSSVVDYGFSVRYVKDTGVPVVSTIAASEISNKGATMNGSIDSNGGEAIKECGIYWSKTNTTPNSGDSIALSKINDGQFSVSLTGLESNTSYYFRAFASNLNGIALGKVLMFTTNIESNPTEYGSALLGGNVYKTITIGEQTWMAENFRELPMVSPATFNSDKVSMCYVYGYAGTNPSEAKQSDFYAKYGVLYNWIAANFYCPDGWHLPSVDEWKQLTNYIQANSGVYLNNSNVGKSLALQNSWFEQPEGNYNSTGFSAVPGGMFQSEIAAFVHNATNGFWWTLNEATFVNGVYLSAGFFNLYSALGMGFYTDGYRKTYGMSVRYVKDK